jgi:hypothetical protein
MTVSVMSLALRLSSQVPITPVRVRPLNGRISECRILELLPSHLPRALRLVRSLRLL